MANWFYYDGNGQKQGPVTGGQLKGLAKAGMITPETVVETEEGKTAPARKVKGLTFVEAGQIEAPSQIESSTFTAEEQAEIDKFCEKYGSDVKKVDEKLGSTLLHLATVGGGASPAVVKYLVLQGADILAKDKQGETPLHSAAGWGNIEIVKFLVSQGADVLARDNNGNTPLWQTTTGIIPKIEILEFLISRGADVKAKDKEGKTLLHTIGNIGGIKNIEFVKCLVSNGADVNAKDKDGNTPLHAAAGNPGTVEFVKYLVSQGADIRAQGWANTTPLDYASKLSDATVVEYLISINAPTLRSILTGMADEIDDGVKDLRNLQNKLASAQEQERKAKNLPSQSSSSLPIHQYRNWHGSGEGLLYSLLSLVSVVVGILMVGLTFVNNQVHGEELFTPISMLGVIMATAGIIGTIAITGYNLRCPSCKQSWVVKMGEIHVLIYNYHLSKAKTSGRFRCNHCGYEWIYEYDTTNTSTALPPVDQVKPPNVPLPLSMSTANSITERDARCPELLSKNENTWTAHMSLILGIVALIPTLIHWSCSCFGLNPFPLWVTGSFLRFNYSVWFILDLLPQIALVPGVFLGCKGLKTSAARIAKSGLIVCGISYLVPILFNLYFYVEAMIFGL